MAVSCNNSDSDNYKSVTGLSSNSDPLVNIFMILNKTLDFSQYHFPNQ